MNRTVKRAVNHLLDSPFHNDFLEYIRDHNGVELDKLGVWIEFVPPGRKDIWLVDFVVFYGLMMKMDDATAEQAILLLASTTDKWF